ncbi:hypothetical protein D3C76_1195750 [compost metagenome]
MLHFGSTHHGPRQLSFQRTLIVDLLAELGHAVVGLVEQLETSAATSWHAGIGQVHAGGGDGVFGDFDHPLADTVGQLPLPEGGEDCCLVGFAGVLVQHRPGWPSQPP